MVNCFVTALYKSGDKHLPYNYRPVILPSVICKMLECIITNHLLQYFMLNGFFTSRQYGFRSQHSCETQLIHVLNDWTSALESVHQVYISYLDLQKEFDMIKYLLCKIVV